MILSCNFEELRALASGATLLLSSTNDGGRSAAARADVEALQPRLVGDIEVTSAEDQRSLRRAVAGITDTLHRRMDAVVVEHHPAHEEAVLLYFEYAHTRGVLHRLDRIGESMRALEDLMKGAGV